MKMLNLSENELLDINGGKGLIDVDDIYKGLRDVYTDVRDHGYDAAKDFCSGFRDGWNSVED